MINSKTKIVALIGSPVGHSISPIIHNEIYKLEKENMVYLAFDIKTSELESFVQSAKTLGIHGFNITMPHKESIIPYIDEFVGNHKSVNTVKIEDGKLIGTSTDAYGFAYLLEKNNIDIKNKKVVILGIGGASNTIASRIHNKCSLTVVGRNKEQLINMSKNFLCEYSLFSDIDEIKNIDILINATPLGMHGISENFDNFNFLHNINNDGVVIDTIYNPVKTRLILEALKLNIYAYNGLDMLLGQAFKSHSFWFLKELGCNVIEGVQNTIISHYTS